MLLLAVFTVNDRQNTTFPFIYFLTIVGLSYALSDMIRTRGQSSESVDSEAHMGHEIRRQAYPTAVPFTALVVGPAMQSNLPSRTVPVYATPDPPIVQFNDSPPPYDDCPPPKYEDAIKETKWPSESLTDKVYEDVSWRCAIVIAIDTLAQNLIV